LFLLSITVLDDTENHCQLAECLWPWHMGQKLPKSTYLPLKDVGAVEFGHNTGIGWIWNDFGGPEKGEPPLTDEESDDDDPVDSGMGSSIRSSTIPKRTRTYRSWITYALKHENYEVAVICALSNELMAIRALFDDQHQDLSRNENDTNTNVLGGLGNHNVVAACLPYEKIRYECCFQGCLGHGENLPFSQMVFFWLESVVESLQKNMMSDLVML